MKLLSVTLILFSIPIFFFGKSFNASVGSKWSNLFLSNSFVYLLFLDLYERKTDFMNKKWIYLIILFFINFSYDIVHWKRGSSNKELECILYFISPFTILVENIFEKRQN